MEDKMMVKQIDPSEIERYSKVPTSFEVNKILQVQIMNKGLGGIHLIEQECVPHFKDYDLDEDVHPLNWSRQFDLGVWGLFVAKSDDMYVGGVAIAPQIKGFKEDMAVLWDLRVHPDFRDKGIGGKLLNAAVNWAEELNFRKLVVETQNNNVAACKFYSKNGFYLGTIDIHGYSSTKFESEAKLLWYMDL